MKWVLIIGYFFMASREMIPIHEDANFTSELACQSVQVTVVEENRDSIMDGRVVVLCKPKE